ncbi:DUF72 domain-containing protein [Pseudoxanthomonas suwonensis]|uniref:DUF72 domain-containing protein n=1 Tax=Pseudoxanthomonas suwonensis TaxID=314722 RepID=UPI000464529B|nr:DUF72 domain-containing protein [Pseudoxanthomonas suwonensis]
MAKARARIGCAGWSIPRQHAHLFGEGDSMLARYATRFDVAEINSSFYRPHQAKTYARWAASVPRGFRFSVKLPRTISHELALRGAGPALDQFLDEAAGLGRKLGGFLLQLPPGLAFEPRVVATFLAMFRRRTAAPLAVEPRHASWFSPQASALLLRHQASRIGADPPRAPGAEHPDEGAPWPYWRLHGSPRIYYSEYGEEALRGLAARVAATRTRASPWVIFDNTAHGFAVADAAKLQGMLGIRDE